MARAGPSLAGSDDGCAPARGGASLHRPGWIRLAGVPGDAKQAVPQPAEAEDAVAGARSRGALETITDDRGGLERPRHPLRPARRALAGAARRLIARPARRRATCTERSRPRRTSTDGCGCICSRWTAPPPPPGMAGTWAIASPTIRRDSSLPGPATASASCCLPRRCGRRSPRALRSTTCSWAMRRSRRGLRPASASAAPCCWRRRSRGCASWQVSSAWRARGGEQCRGRRVRASRTLRQKIRSSRAD